MRKDIKAFLEQNNFVYEYRIWNLRYGIRKSHKRKKNFYES